MKGGTMHIEDVVIWRVGGKFGGEIFPPGDRQSQQLDVYPEFNNRSGLGAMEAGRPIQALYAEVIGDEGHSGIFGPIQDIQAYVILKYLRPFLRGRDPLATELLLDQMLRMD